MKIIVPIVIDLDAKVWNETYGHDETATEIRDCVKEATGVLVQQDFDNRGLVATVTVKR